MINKKIISSAILAVAAIIGCQESQPKQLEFDLVELKINKWPDRDIKIGLFRNDTAFASAYTDIFHRSKREADSGNEPDHFLNRENDDSILEEKEVPVSRQSMSRINELVNSIDFKKVAIARGKDKVLDGTLWTLNVSSSIGYQSSISFRGPSSLPINAYKMKIETIADVILGLHGKKISDMPK